MWQLERDEQGFWAVSGDTRVGPFTRPGAAREYMRKNEPPAPPPPKRVRKADDEE